jgi:hypothetical protein
MRVFTLVLILFGSSVVWLSSADAAVLIETSFESQPCNQVLVNGTMVTGVMLDVPATKVWCTQPCDDPTTKDATVLCTVGMARHGTKFLEWHSICSTYNASGRCTGGGSHDGGTDWGDNSLNIPIPTDATVYLAGFIRVDRVASRDVWIDTGSPNSWDKVYEYGGHSTSDATRWGIGVGWPNSDYTATNGKFTFDAWCASSVISGACNPDHFVQNVAPYGSATPFLADYGRWYAMVLEVLMKSNTTGYVKLYINGINITSRSGLKTRNTSGNIVQFFSNGTWAQTGYDIPEHIRYMDHWLLTTTLADVTAGGFMTDPEGGTPPDTTPPAAPTGVTITKAGP